MRKTPKKPAEELKAEWIKNQEKRRAEIDRRIREPNELMTLLRETYRAFREPHILVLHRILISYGLGNFKGRGVRREVKRLGADLLCAGSFPLHFGGEINFELPNPHNSPHHQNSNHVKTHAAIAAQEGIVANSFGSAARRVGRARSDLKKRPVTPDGFTGLFVLVGVAKDLDELWVVERDIRNTMSKIVNDPNMKTKDKGSHVLKKRNDKEGSRATRLQLQEYGMRLTELFNSALDIQSKVPRQITLTDICWVPDNRAARQAIADGRLVELCRSQAPLGIQA